MSNGRGSETGGATPGRQPQIAGVGPDATPEVVAALSAAVWECWPRPVVVLAEQERRPSAGWRFSGRWWAKPSAVRRDRPWAFR